MFDTVRKHQKILQIVLMLLIVPSFVLFGISGYSGFMDKETDIVKINGKAITAQEVESAAKRQAERVGEGFALLFGFFNLVVVTRQIAHTQLAHHFVTALHIK